MAWHHLRDEHPVSLSKVVRPAAALRRKSMWLRPAFLLLGAGCYRFLLHSPQAQVNQVQQEETHHEEVESIACRTGAVRRRRDRISRWRTGHLQLGQLYEPGAHQEVRGDLQGQGHG